jgi:hypothetical protein
VWKKEGRKEGRECDCVWAESGMERSGREERRERKGIWEEEERKRDRDAHDRKRTEYGKGVGEVSGEDDAGANKGDDKARVVAVLGQEGRGGRA